MEALDSPVAGVMCRTGAAAEIHRCLTAFFCIGREARQSATSPPVRLATVPVMPLARSDARKAAASAPSPNQAFGSGFTTPSGVHRLLPSPVRRGLGRVLVVPVPPLVGRGLRV